jgi:hypothetical protein
LAFRACRGAIHSLNAPQPLARSLDDRREKLRVALILTGDRPERWAADTAAEIAANPLVDLAWVSLRPPACTESRFGFVNDNTSAVTRLVIDAYSKLERRIYRAASSELDRVELSSELRAKTARSVDEDRIDIIIDLRRHSDSREYVDQARFGVLSVRSSSARTRDRSFYDVLRHRSPVVVAVDLVRTDSDDRTLAQSTGAAHPLSAARTFDAACSKYVVLIRRALRALVDGEVPGRTSANRDAVDATRPNGSRRGVSVFAVPTGPKVIHFALYVLFEIVTRTTRVLLFKDEWFLAIRPRPAHARSTGPFEVPAEPFTRISSPRGFYFADPQVLEEDDKSFVFFECYSHARRRAAICYSVVGDRGLETPPRSALERPYHLSYPNVFRFEGNVFMIPESSANRTLELYRARVFPDVWELEAVLLEDVTAADATVFFRDGVLWLFAGFAERAGASADDELFLFSAVRPSGPWQPHPLNPVVADVRFARPAGPVFDADGVWVRPAQDCRRAYGSAISFRSIDELSSTSYRESEIGHLQARDVLAGATGVHSYVRYRGGELIDGFGKRPRLHLPSRRASAVRRRD